MSIEKLREAVRQLGKCGSCGGSGQYLNRGFKSGKFVSDVVPCTKCEGTGMNKIARDALNDV